MNGVQWYSRFGVLSEKETCAWNGTNVDLTRVLPHTQKLRV